MDSVVWTNMSVGIFEKCMVSDHGKSYEKKDVVTPLCIQRNVFWVGFSQGTKQICVCVAVRVRAL